MGFDTVEDNEELSRTIKCNTLPKEIISENKPDKPSKCKQEKEDAKPTMNLNKKFVLKLVSMP